jgi:hypothetical protein
MNRDELLFSAVVSSKYHQRRHSFLLIFDTMINLVVVLAGASAFSAIVGGNNTDLAKWASATATFLGIIQIVLGIGKAAHAHQSWHARWRSLLVDIESSLEPDQTVLERWSRAKMSIEVECVSELRALEVDCRNKAISQLDLDPTELRHITWWQRVIIQVGTLQSNFDQRMSDKS